MKLFICLCAFVYLINYVNCYFIAVNNQVNKNYLWQCTINNLSDLQQICNNNVKTCSFKTPFHFKCTVLNTCNLLSGKLLADGCTITNPKK